MNLRLVAALSVLGLVSCPVFAASSMTGTDTTADTTPTTVTKTKHHQHHHMVKRQVEANYKEEVPTQPAPMETCTLSQNELVMESMTQNAGRSVPSPCNPGWFNRVRWSGGVNVDIGKWGNRNANLMGENYQIISLNDAYLNVAANINDWVSAFASVSFNSATIQNIGESSTTEHVAEYGAPYNTLTLSGSNIHNLELEQAFFTIGNLDLYPLFLQVGRQFQDFSRYDIHPITRSLTQSMSESNAVSAKLGFVSHLGFNGSVYVFNNPIRKIVNTSYPTNWGVSFGFDQSVCNWSWDFGAAYLYDMMGVNDIAYNVAQFNYLQGDGIRYNSRNDGVAVYGDASYGPFFLSARYTTALQRFNALDLPEHGIADTNQLTGQVNNNAAGAKPWAAGVMAGYVFDGLWEITQNIYLGYETSREAAALQLPQYRYVAGFGLSPWQNTHISIEWDHDDAFASYDGGSNRHTNLVSIRVASQFA